MSTTMIDAIDDPTDGSIHAAAIQKSMAAFEAHMIRNEDLKARIAEEIATPELPRSTRKLFEEILVHITAAA